ncbi:MAG: alpha/beta fold hydrolase [Candidatus Nezhaarchaeales archaeon]
MKRSRILLLIVVVVLCLALASYLGYYYGYTTATAERMIVEETLREEATKAIEDVKKEAVNAIKAIKEDVAKAIDEAVKAAKAPVYVVGVEPVPGITVDWLTPYEEVLAKLPKAASVILSNGSKVPSPLNWTSITDPLFPEYTYSPYTAGVYRATATVSLPYGVYCGDPKLLVVTTNVTVMTPLLPYLYPNATPLTDPRYRALFNQPGTYKSEWVVVDGLNRTYHYYVPSYYNGTQRMPLVISLHGAWSCGLANLLGADDYAEKFGFILVCPDSYGYIWNIPGVVTGANVTIDVNFISKLIDVMSEKYNIDTKRVYVVGISAGGMMATYLALYLPHKIAAVGIISGALSLAALADAGVKFPRPMTFVITAGTYELLFGAPFDEHLRARKAVTYLVEQFNCSRTPEVTFWPDPKAKGVYWPPTGERTAVVRYVYSGGVGGVQVVYFEIIGGGHCWPGGMQYSLPSSVGWVTYHVEAWSDCLWPYLSKCTLP